MMVVTRGGGICLSAGSDMSCGGVCSQVRCGKRPAPASNNWRGRGRAMGVVTVLVAAERLRARR